MELGGSSGLLPPTITLTYFLQIEIARGVGAGRELIIISSTLLIDVDMELWNYGRMLT